MLEIARQMRPSLYDLQFEKPRPLVPRDRCFGIAGAARRARRRPDRRSTQAPSASRRRASRARGVEAVAICLLHCLRQPRARARRSARSCGRRCPTSAISLSSRSCPEFREYYRASTTVDQRRDPARSWRTTWSSIEARLRRRGRRRRAAGHAEQRRRADVRERRASGPSSWSSPGPAAGVIAAAVPGRRARTDADVISFDMGGTTAKAGLVQDGTPRVTKDYEVGGPRGAAPGRARGSGYPIRTPVIDLVEIGAGGGIDRLGRLRRGAPGRAATAPGADPGPACYGRGGTKPTVTDANLVLGRLNPDVLPRRRARARRRRRRSGRSTRALRRAARARRRRRPRTASSRSPTPRWSTRIRLVSVQRGYDPRDFALVGVRRGRAASHANRLAAEIDIATDDRAAEPRHHLGAGPARRPTSSTSTRRPCFGGSTRCRHGSWSRPSARWSRADEST